MRNFIVPAFLAALLAAAAPSARAQMIIDVTQSGSNVIATTSGSLNVSGLTKDSAVFSAVVWPGFSLGSVIVTGPTVEGFVDAYNILSGPTSFGSGDIVFASGGIGDRAGVVAGGVVYLPEDYVSGASISSTAAWLGQTFGSLGLSAGTYTWTIGSGADQVITLNIGTSAAIPEPGPLALAGLTAAGALAARVRRVRRAA